MNNPLPEKFQEIIWRRKLTAEERAQVDAWLASHPEAREDLADEPALTAILGRLPDAPVPSNFTARVLAEVEHTRRRRHRHHHSHSTSAWRWLSGWLPRAAVATLVLGVTVLGWHQHRVSDRAGLVRSMTESVVLLSPEVFVDFDLIARVGPAAPDRTLLHALE